MEEQVSLRRLLISIGLVAAGLAMIAPMLQGNSQSEYVWQTIIAPSRWLGGTFLIGFGLLHPIKCGWIGAAVVFIMHCMIGYAWLP